MNLRRSVWGVVALALVLCSGCRPPSGGPYDPTQPIRKEKGNFYQGDVQVNPVEVGAGLEREPIAKSHMHRARTLYGLNTFLVAPAAGICLGIPLGQAVVGEDPNGAVAAVGFGLLALDIVLIIATVAAENKAIAVHNKSVQPPGVALGSTRLEFRPQGVALAF